MVRAVGLAGDCTIFAKPERACARLADRPAARDDAGRDGGRRCDRSRGRRSGDRRSRRLYRPHGHWPRCLYGPRRGWCRCLYRPRRRCSPRCQHHLTCSPVARETCASRAGLARWQIQAIRLADDGILRNAEAPADFRRSDGLVCPPRAQVGDLLFRPLHHTCIQAGAPSVRSSTVLSSRRTMRWPRYWCGSPCQ